MRTYNFGRGKWVFIDWMGIDPGYGTAWSGEETAAEDSVPKGLELKVHQPRVHADWVIAPEKPWEKLGISPYASFLEDQGRFHCWYECYGDRDDMGIEVNVAYAVSEDGIHWTRPCLGIREVDGSTDNNLTDLRNHGACVFIDPAAPPEERFKTGGLHLVRPQQVDREAMARGEKWWRQVGGLVSADGLRWTHLPEPILPRNYCDTQTVIRYDPVLQKYVLFTRQKNGLMKRRGINRSESEDFRAFPPSTPLFETEPIGPVDWDFQAPGYHPWPGTDHAHLMLPTVFYRTQDRMGIHLATSRDTVCWHRPMGREALIHPEDLSLERDVVWLHASHGILTTAPGEWSYYLRPYFAGHNEGKLNRVPSGLLRAVCREDGFVSLSSEGFGEFWTVPFAMNSEGISLNVKCAYSGWMKVGVERVLGEYNDMASVAAEAIDGYSLEDCAPVRGDQSEAPLSWKAGSVARLQGQTVRLHVQMYKTDLYAIRFGGF